MSHTYIALFRGINVGGKHLLPMKELAAMLQDLGYEEIQTYIQSGNVVFSSQHELGEQAAGDISQCVLDSKGFEPRVLLLSVEAWQHAIDNNPFPTEIGKALHLSFLTSEPEHPDLDMLTSLKSASEQFSLAGTVFYLYAPDGIGRSKLAGVVEKCIGVPATSRNWNTVQKIAVMAGLA